MPEENDRIDPNDQQVENETIEVIDPITGEVGTVIRPVLPSPPLGYRIMPFSNSPLETPLNQIMQALDEERLRDSVNHLIQQNQDTAHMATLRMMSPDLNLAAPPLTLERLAELARFTRRAEVEREVLDDPEEMTPEELVEMDRYLDGDVGEEDEDEDEDDNVGEIHEVEAQTTSGVLEGLVPGEVFLDLSLPDAKPTKKSRPIDPTKIERIHILGSGGVGFWLTVVLMSSNPRQKVLVYDDDNFVGGTGHTRLPHVSNRNMKKVQLLKGYCKTVMNCGMPEIFPRRFDLTDARKMNSKDLVLDCTDMALAPRTEIHKMVKEKKSSYLRVSYDGLGIISCAFGPPYNGNDAGGYERVPNLAQSQIAGGIGCEWVRKFLRGERIDEQQIEC